MTMRAGCHPSFLGKLFPIAAIVLLLLAVPCSKGNATEEYARLTGKGCSTCHLDPAGGGELTSAGRAFQASRALPGRTEGMVQPRGSGSRLLRFLAGYIHLLGAIFWFGTILYVHMVLKPAYAAHGLPRGEVRVGFVSMAVMAISGAVLTAYRLPSPAALLTSRFGILLAIKIGLFLVMAVSALFAVLVIGPRLKKAAGAGGNIQAGDMGSDELSACDGTNGNPACFAYRGEIYDASASRLWKNGLHAGRHHAGEDLTEMLGQAPHGEEKVLAMPRVGRLLSSGEKRGRPLPEKVFFFMAYMNLTMVFLIVLIVALWRWW
jgi:predicted heme/steroid binding protein